MRRISGIVLSIVFALGVTGCGSSKNDSAEVQRLIEKGCQEFTKAVQEKSSEASYVETFSKLAILNPSYLEISRAAGIYSTTSILTPTSAGGQFKEMYVESVGTLFGFCQSVK